MALAQLTGEDSDSFFLNLQQTSEYLQNLYQVRPSARESRKINFSTDPGFGRQCAVVVPADGDLLVGATLELKLRKLPNEFPVSRASYYPVEATTRRVNLSVGGTTLDTHTSDFFRIYDEYMRTVEESQNYRRIANFDPDTLSSAVTCTETLYLPMVFSFLRDRQSGLPMAGLHGCEVKFVFDFATAAEVGVDPTVFEAALYIDSVLVDAGVRKYLAGRPQNIVFEQLQYNGGQLVDVAQETCNTNIRAQLGFRRQTKAIWWMLKETEAQNPERTNHARFVGDWQNTYLALQPSQNDFGGYNLLQSISEKLAPVRRARLVFDNVDRFPARTGRIFNTLQPLNHCRRAPLPGTYCYAFSDDITTVQPTPGLINLSKIKTQQLYLQLKKNTTAPVTDVVAFAGSAAEEYARNITGLKSLEIYAWSYNILRIERGTARVCIS